jgi:hypothetical protein
MICGAHGRLGDDREILFFFFFFFLRFVFSGQQKRRLS